MAALLAVLFFAAACGNDAIHVGVPVPAGRTPSGPGLCPHEAGVPALPRYPTQAITNELRIAWVLRCTPGVAERADTPAPALLTALAGPSERLAHPGQCPTRGAILPFYLALITVDDNVVAPDVPVDACGLAKPDLVAAMARLPFHRIAAT